MKKLSCVSPSDFFSGEMDGVLRLARPKMGTIEQDILTILQGEVKAAIERLEKPTQQHINIFKSKLGSIKIPRLAKFGSYSTATCLRGIC